MIEILKNYNILYVEDDDVVRNTFGKILKLAFKDVKTAGNGQEALEIYENSKKENTKIDLIISDITMPVMDGYQLLKTIREKNDNVPFIVTTAHGDMNTILKIKEFEVSDYVTKPVDIQKILFKCKEIFEK